MERAIGSRDHISQALGFDQSTVVQIIDGLEALGLVVRSRDGTDRRRNGVDLTADGAAVLERGRAAAAEVEERLFCHISAEEKSTLHGLLATLVAGHDALLSRS